MTPTEYATLAFQRRHIAITMKRLELPNERGVWAWIRRVWGGR